VSGVEVDLVQIDRRFGRVEHDWEETGFLFSEPAEMLL
jgi:hypothetical protein